VTAVRFSRLGICGLLAGIIGCTDPSTANVVESDYGLVYTAAPFLTEGSNLFRLEVRVSNPTSRTITLNFQSDCRVGIRLYNLRQERVYDEARPCQSLNVQTISINPGFYITLNTGHRILGTVFGDSIPRGTYRARAVVGIENRGWFEVPAGTLVYAPAE
jgi:hypothetical protein